MPTDTALNQRTGWRAGWTGPAIISTAILLIGFLLAVLFDIPPKLQLTTVKLLSGVDHGAMVPVTRVKAGDFLAASFTFTAGGKMTSTRIKTESFLAVMEGIPTSRDRTPREVLVRPLVSAHPSLPSAFAPFPTAPLTPYDDLAPGGTMTVPMVLRDALNEKLTPLEAQRLNAIAPASDAEQPWYLVAYVKMTYGLTGRLLPSTFCRYYLPGAPAMVPCENSLRDRLPTQ